MGKIAIILCNFASISDEAAERYGITSIESPLSWPEEPQLTGDNIFQKMRDALNRGINSFPKTSQPSIGTFKKYFEEALKDNDEVICITISSKISGTYNAALQTKNFLGASLKDKVHIIDSNNIDVGEGLLGIKAVEVSQEGDTIEKVIEKIRSYVPKVYFYGMTESPRQMEAGGRIDHVLAAILMQMQKIGMRPILHMADGVVKPANLKMNAKNTAEALFRQFEDKNREQLSKGKCFRVAISHADNLEEADELKLLFETRYPTQSQVDFINMTGIFIGSHVGPGTLMCCVLED
ncbi:MAG: DegV family protein [Candidatus Pacebacteria bacterium]|nr:DegV family protein [Candidatus Paceibacterota bacterium]